MFDSMKQLRYPVNKKERKLCTLLSTHNEFMPFSSYYLWFLIDYCHFVVDEIRSLVLFGKHDSFNGFVSTFATERKKALANKDNARQKFCKLVMNGSCGFESLNCERYTKTRFYNSARTMSSHQYSNFRCTTPITNDLFAVEIDPGVVSPKTPIQSAVFTLDNAKFWLLNFVYRYLSIRLDKDKYMILYTDTDSLYIAVADEETEACLLGMTDWIPSEKELLKFQVETVSDNFLAVGPKSYTCWEAAGNKTIKSKGVAECLLDADDFVSVLTEGKAVIVNDSHLENRGGVIHEIDREKVGLSSIANKNVVLNSGVCIPFMHGVDARVYDILTESK
jgi:hypothetical protein